MKRMKPLALLLALALLFSLLSACSSSPVSTSAQPSSDFAPVVQDTTFFAAPETSFFASSVVSSSDDDERLSAFLDGLVDALNKPDSDTLYYYSLDEDGVFFTISMPAFDYFLENLDSVSSSDLADARKIALDFVAGKFAEDLIAHVRSHGGASKSVYITLGGARGLCMASCDLTVFIDNLKR